MPLQDDAQCHELLESLHSEEKAHTYEELQHFHHVHMHICIYVCIYTSTQTI